MIYIYLRIFQRTSESGARKYSDDFRANSRQGF